jgi:uncharacterized protein YbjT (DUF2867 family)
VHPRTNELKVYNPQGPGFGPNPATGIAFSVVAFLQNTRQSGNVLILAGTGAEATEAAARLVTDVSNLPIALKNCDDASNRPLMNFELLIKVDIMAGSPTNTNVVAIQIGILFQAHFSMSPLDEGKPTLQLTEKVAG